MAETHRYRTDNGTLLTGVSLPDYAALVAERDEWKRRCEEWKGLYERAIAIAEGRDNG